MPLGGTRGALKRYRVMALIVGTGLALLCFVGIPVQVVGHYVDHVGSWPLASKWPWTSVAAIIGPIHGFAYIVYLLACLDLAGRARLRPGQLLAMVASGLLPLLAFYTERRVVKRVEAQLALGADAPPGPAATIWASLTGRARATAVPVPPAEVEAE